MLRAKQLGTLSQCARTFYLSGSRCSLSDGAPCTCSEDESPVSRWQSNTSGLLLKHKNSTAVSQIAGKGVPSGFKTAVGSVSHHSDEHRVYAVSGPHAVSCTPTSRSESSNVNVKPNSTVDDARGPQKRSVHPSKMSKEHLVKKTGIATVGALSELMNQNQKIPSTYMTPDTHTVDSTQPLPNTKSSRGRSRNRGKYSKVQQNQTINSGTASSSSSTSDSVPSYKPGKPGSSKTKKSIPQTSGVPNRPLSSTQVDQRQSVPRREKFHSVGFVSDSKSGGDILVRKASSTMPENKLQNPTRSTRQEAGGAPTVHRTFRAVELYYHTLQQIQHWGPEAEEVLNNIHCRLDVFQANQVLKLLHDHSLAFGFFKWLKHQTGFKHDNHTYTTMIAILGQARQFGPMKRLLDEMVADGGQPTVVTFNRIIHAYGRANYIAEAVKVFHEMQGAGYEPDRVTYCTLIDIHAKSGYLEVALDLYQRMQEVGLTPDTFTYSVMVNCLGKGGQLSAAYRLFCEMIDHGCIPNLVTYNIMITLQAKSRNYTTAVKLYKDMQAAGFRPDRITYSIVMEALGHYGSLDEVESVFMEMKRDWVPDEPAFGLLVDLWGKTGNVDKARAWYQSMLNAGLRPNVPTCNSLLSAFLRARRFSDAYDVLANMIGLGLVPSLQTYTLLLSCCTEVRPEMGLCCKLMAITGHPAHMFLLSLPDAEPGGQNVRDHADSFFDLVHCEDRDSKRGIVDAMIDFLHKSGLKEEAGFVWEVAQQRNVYPDSLREKRSSYWLINLHVMSEGTAVTALSRTLAWFKREMLVSGIAPRRIDIVTGWGKRTRITGASLVRQAIEELLYAFRFPFFTERGNSGCFVGCGEPLNRWLLNPYVERMHLI